MLTALRCSQIYHYLANFHSRNSSHFNKESMQLGNSAFRRCINLNFQNWPLWLVLWSRVTYLDLIPLLQSFFVGYIMFFHCNQSQTFLLNNATAVLLTDGILFTQHSKIFKIKAKRIRDNLESFWICYMSHVGHNVNTLEAMWKKSRTILL